jgi:hypothetical protein
MTYHLYLLFLRLINIGNITGEFFLISSADEENNLFHTSFRFTALFF